MMAALDGATGRKRRDLSPERDASESNTTPTAKRPCASPRAGPPGLDDLRSELARGTAGPLMKLLSDHSMPMLFDRWIQCGANAVATELDLCQNFPSLDESQTVQDGQVLSPVHGAASSMSELALRTPPGGSPVTQPPDAIACTPVPAQLLVHPVPTSLPPVTVPEHSLSRAGRPTAMRSELAPTTAAPLTAGVQEPVASSPVLVTVQPVPPIPVPVQLQPAAPSALELDTTFGLAQPPPGAAALLPSAHGSPTILWPAPAMPETSATQVMDAVTLDYRPKHQSHPAPPVVPMSNCPAGFAVQHHPGLRAIFHEGAQEPHVPHHDIVPQQLFNNNVVPAAAVEFVTPPRGQPSQPLQV